MIIRVIGRGVGIQSDEREPPKTKRKYEDRENGGYEEGKRLMIRAIGGMKIVGGMGT